MTSLWKRILEVYREVEQKDADLLVNAATLMEESIFVLLMFIQKEEQRKYLVKLWVIDEKILFLQQKFGAEQALGQMMSAYQGITLLRGVMQV
jgi:hypothetical protein